MNKLLATTILAGVIATTAAAGINYDEVQHGIDIAEESLVETAEENGYELATLQTLSLIHI